MTDRMDGGAPGRHAHHGAATPLAGMDLASELVAAGRRIQAELAGRERLALVGLGWATVELGRASRELTTALGPALEAGFVPAADDPWLGGYCEVGRLAGGYALVLVEPNTEGRVAGSLVRFGEAVVAAYVARMPGRRALEGRSLVPPAPGPIGPARLIASGRRGPHLLLVEDATGWLDPSPRRVTIAP